jgi:hypothetical protein
MTEPDRIPAPVLDDEPGISWQTFRKEWLPLILDSLILGLLLGALALYVRWRTYGY